ncbi:RNA helicase family protein isoform 1 [Hibiscus syriacus]|uniref:RNA helicase family protein isoform 1 n=1 Tax=Hibiscus syriacus TaxID=106335 RepID=A0A6A3C1L4_HIBSY|nr:RNA helicase family protein isoform 1 [Hibiscus syriacus]
MSCKDMQRVMRRRHAVLEPSPVGLKTLCNLGDFPKLKDAMQSWSLQVRLEDVVHSLGLLKTRGTRGIFYCYYRIYPRWRNNLRVGLFWEFFPHNIFSTILLEIEFTVAILLLTLTISNGSSGSVKKKAGLVSDGMDRTTESSVFELHLHRTTTVTCEPTYGFLPCTTKPWGQLFLLVVYEYLLSPSKHFISSGSNIFFQMFGTGIFGASLFNVLGIFPQVILVLVNGVSASEETAQTKETISMAILAGSTIMMLTLIWASVIAFGSYDLSNNKPFSLTGYGVRTDPETKYSAMIMLLSMIPFLILQLAKILSSGATARRAIVLISLLTSFVLLAGYCTYQVFEPWIQNRRLEYLMRKYIERNLGKDNQPWWNYIKAAFLVTLGTTATIMLSKPLVAALVEFSTSANVPLFLVSYVVVPLALHFRQGFRAVSSARQKTDQAASLTFSEVYGEVFMNNVMGLGTFLVPIYVRGISWGVSAEVVVVLLVCTTMGVLATFRTKFQFWTCILVYMLYPMSLLLLYVLTNVLGWS